MAEPATPCRLLALPWELRRPIIVEVLKHKRTTPPIFSRKLIKGRMRLHNCFDADFPEVTNIYIPRQKNRHLAGNGLRATNRQLRHETDLLIQEELKTGKIGAEFILDMMIVKDIGVFPTWISFPYQPEHIKRLQIDLRIVRPGNTTVPTEWIDVARSQGSDDQVWSNIVMVMVLYAFGFFSVNPAPEPRHQPVPRKPTDPKPTATEKKETIPSASRPKAKKNKSGARLNIVSHQSKTVNAYLLPSATYVADELFLNLHIREYHANGKLVPLEPTEYEKMDVGWGLSVKLGDRRTKSRYYREGYTQFGRSLFVDWRPSDPAPSVVEEQHDMIVQGLHAGCELLEAVTELVLKDDGAYVEMMASSVGEVTLSRQGVEHATMLVPQGVWNDTYYYDEEYTEAAAVEQGLAEQMALESEKRDKHYINTMLRIQSRRRHGWKED